MEFKGRTFSALLFVAICGGGTVMAQQPQTEVVKADYYESAFKLYGSALRTALHNIIKGHTSVSYASLWTHFQTTDKKPNGKVWDMYSDVPGGTPAYEYTFVTDQCGSYSGEGSCYNREHSFPQSWFNSATIPSSDLYHIFPTDGYVNGKRSNFNYGTVSTSSWTSTNGSKLGPNTSAGYTGTVFEPIDAYKGDLARGTFYMSVRYYTEDGSWASSDGTNKSDLLPWYANVLYDWHIRDTVSSKEVNRNTAVYGIQNNRNPFIDHPEFVAEIWKTSMPPQVISATGIGVHTVVLDFSRCLDSIPLMAYENFVCGELIGSPLSVQWGVNNDFSKVLLVFPPLLPNHSYQLQVKNIRSINGILSTDTVVTFLSSGASLSEDSKHKEFTFRLEQNFPNPFNPTTKIVYSIMDSPLKRMKGSNPFVNLVIYDMLGRIVRTLVNQTQSVGEYFVQFDGTELCAGTYFYELRIDGYRSVRKMLYLR